MMKKGEEDKKRLVKKTTKEEKRLIKVSKPYTQRLAMVSYETNPKESIRYGSIPVEKKEASVRKLVPEKKKDKERRRNAIRGYFKNK